jgi:hypothetical protein
MTQNTDQWNPARTETAIESIAVDDEDVLAALTGHSVLIRAEQEDNPNCQHTLLATVNLLSRLDTVIDVIEVMVTPETVLDVYHPGVTGDRVVDGVQSIADRVGSPVDLAVVEESSDEYDIVIALGSVEADSSEFTVRAGSNGWLAHVSTETAAITFGEQVNPVGAYAAGCMAVAEIFKYVLQSEAGDAVAVPIKHVNNMVFSTLDYSVNAADPDNPPLPKLVDVESLHVFGVGAGGGALVHVLSAVDELAGEIQLVDSDEVSRSNLNRYIWAFADDVDAMKTEVGQGRLRSAHSDLYVSSHPVPYVEFADAADTDTFDLVVSTVDSAEAREEIQWDLPRTVLDAATNQDGYYVVSRAVLGETQCLSCKHSQRDGKHREMEVVSDRVGLPVDTLLDMDKDNAAFSEGQVAAIESYANDDHGFTVPDPDERFSDWFGDQCGHMDLSVADDPVPVPFPPVTAGVLLAGEVIKDRYFPEHRVENKFTHNMFYLPRQRMHSFTGPDSNCMICQNERVIDRYRAKWRGNGG